MTPDDAGALVSRASVYLDKGDDERGFADADRAIALDPEQVAAYVNRGSVISPQGRDTTTERSRTMTRPSRWTRNSPAPTSIAATLMRARANTTPAIKDYDQAIKLDPDYAGAYNSRGYARSGKGDYDAAIEDYDRALEMEPDVAYVHLNRGIAYYYKGDYDQSIRDYSRSIELDPKDGWGYHNRGLSYYKKGEFDKAIQDYGRAVELMPDELSSFVQSRLGLSRPKGL